MSTRASRDLTSPAMTPAMTPPQSPSSLAIHVWSDVACPWCWIGKRRLETALSRFDGRDKVELRFHAFELDPRVPRPTAAEQPSYTERLAKKYGRSLQEAQDMLDEMTRLAGQEGAEIDFSIIRPGSTFDAHRVIALAFERGVQPAVVERLFRGYFGEGARMSDHETLVRLASEAGMDAEDVRGMLAGERWADAVRADEAEAATLGIRGVPFFVIGRYGVSGAQPADVLLRVLVDAGAEAAA
jgi:predicted DsbA family dithiol-disulfide isomerase